MNIFKKLDKKLEEDRQERLKKDYLVMYNTEPFKSDEDFINEMYKDGYQLISVSQSFFDKKFYFKNIKKY